MKAAVEEAHGRIAAHVGLTECRGSRALGDIVGAEVFLKLENTQLSGSFKLRGVINKILSLSSEDLQKLLVAASTGNHGAAFAHALDVFGLEGRLFMPKTSAAVKIEYMRSTGVPIELVGGDCVEAEAHAKAFAGSGGHVWISPYNDPGVVAGQGTIGLEILEQLETVDAVVAPVGGGGLISGIAAYLKALMPAVEIIGCQPVNSCVMYESIRAGRILDIESLPTVSDGTAGGIEPGAMTFELCRRYVDDFILLEEAEILAAMRFLRDEEALTVEGAAALSTAAVLKDAARFAGRRTVLVVSGGRVDQNTLDRVMSAGAEPGREEAS